MLDAEGALAAALAASGLIDEGTAAVIVGTCESLDIDPGTLGEEAAGSGNPVVPLVRRLTGAVAGRSSSAAGAVHRGATSQDILDTAAMLVTARSAEAIIDDIIAASDACARLAGEHRDTVMAGRTLGQQALPTTFGLTAAGWMVGLDAAGARLEEVQRTRLAVQLGGAAGTLASLGPAGPRVVSEFAVVLGLPEPLLPWHTERSRVVEIAAALGEVAAASGRVARDIVMLSQTEVGEVHDDVWGRGGSSTLPHKQNPVAAVAAIAAAAQAPGLVSTLLTAASSHEYQRATGAWHAEWRALTELITVTGSAVAWLRDALEHLAVDGDRMLANLELTGGLLLAERVTTALAPALGRLAAHDIVTAACNTALEKQAALPEVLAADPQVREHLSAADIERLLAPEAYLGSAAEFVDRALEARQGEPGEG